MVDITSEKLRQMTDQANREKKLQEMEKAHREAEKKQRATQAAIRTFISLAPGKMEKAASEGRDAVIIASVNYDTYELPNMEILYGVQKWAQSLGISTDILVYESGHDGNNGFIPGSKNLVAMW